MEKRCYTLEEQEQIERLKEEIAMLVPHKWDLKLAYDVFIKYWTTYCDNSPSVVEIGQAQRILEFLENKKWETQERIYEIEQELNNKYGYSDY